MNIDLNIISTLISLILGIAGFAAGRLSASKADGKQAGVMLTEMGYLKSGIDDIKAQMRDSDKRYTELNARVVAVEASAKQAHKRLDDHLRAAKEDT